MVFLRLSPGNRIVYGVFIETPHLRRYEVLNDRFTKPKQLAVADDGNFPNKIVVTFDKVQMLSQRIKIRPVGHASGMNNEVRDTVGLIDIAVYLSRKRIHVLGTDQAVRLDHGDVFPGRISILNTRPSSLCGG